ncbi:hypothetical protein [Parasporobacterium paucivorans]|uniref:DUF8180 domain-containing protein n=1 Tax=Parasporobacterium paucivorans DSM 15970 TaxID=1122934 RepID=A0A1M6A9M9_9FIRM|nr:hypothetical protein [Parasporobacterium paucivorans]SHI33126.1 hypothetical protein SAMN02745691_00106 [Parasporobacterium paucivorans DSM 15970]
MHEDIKENGGNNHEHNHEHAHTHTHTHEYPDGMQFTHEHTHMHEGSDASAHSHTHEKVTNNTESQKIISILDYTVSHNIHHAEELSRIADNLESSGMAESAQLIRESIPLYNQANAKLSEALAKTK